MLPMRCDSVTTSFINFSLNRNLSQINMKEYLLTKDLKVMEIDTEVEETEEGGVSASISLDIWE